MRNKDNIQTLLEDCKFGEDTMSGNDVSVSVTYHPNRYSDEAKYEVEIWNPATWSEKPRSTTYRTECEKDAMSRAKFAHFVGSV